MNIVSKKIWSRNSVRDMCINNNLYTYGTNVQYNKMLEKVSVSYPNDEMILIIALNIHMHSENQTITNIMYLLANEAIKTIYELYDEDGNEITD